MSESQKLAKKWIDALKRAGKKQEDKWERKAEKVVERYRDERNEYENEKRLNFLWSNVETLKPALYAKLPKPHVSRRFKDDDPVARQASMIIERALSFHLDAYDFDGAIRAVVEDYLLPGRGVARIVYRPYFGDETQPELDIIEEEDEEGEKRYKTTDGEAYNGEVKQGENGLTGLGEPYQPVVYEEAECQYVYWKDYRHGPGRKRDEIPWEAFRSFYSRKQLVEKFGKIGHKVPLDKKPDTDEETPEMENMAEVWEIWDRETKKVYWVCTSYSEILDQEDAPVDYKEFFSTPAPLSSFTTNGSLVPIPEYCFYQDQAEELNELTQRISLLVKALKVAGIYAGDISEISKLLNEEMENTLIPVDEWAMISEVGGIDNAISWFPVDQVINVVVSLYEAREKTKQELYEITGLSDIVRGASNAAETATAQRIKGQFASLRLSDRQKKVQFFIRDLLKMKAEVICEHFSPQTLQIMTGLQVTPEVMQLLRNDPMRRFRIDIETDSTIEADEQADKEAATEFLGMTSKFLAEIFPIAQQVPEITPLVSKMMMFTARRFRAGRELEESMEEFLDQMEQKAQQPKQESPPPEVIKAQAEIQQKQQEMQMKLQEMQAELQMKSQEQRQEMQLEAAKERQDMALSQQKHAQEMQQDEQSHRLTMQQKAEQARQKAQQEGEQ